MALSRCTYCQKFDVDGDQRSYCIHCGKTWGSVPARKRSRTGAKDDGSTSWLAILIVVFLILPLFVVISILIGKPGALVGIPIALVGGLIRGLVRGKREA